MTDCGTRGSPSAHGPRRSGEAGATLVWALFFVTLTVGVLVAHSMEMSANRRTMDTRYRRIDLAQSVAESGLTDATSWLRRQSVQPVTAFAPQRDEDAVPPVADTLDPAVGLVREFEVHGSLWGRYEVRRDEAVDVSTECGEAPGTVWDLAARGYLFENLDPERPFDAAPNRVLSLQTMRTQVRGVALSLPASAAVIVGDPSQIELLDGATVDGVGGPALAFRGAAGNGNAYGRALQGVPASLPMADLDLSLEKVFGLREDRLRTLADVVVFHEKQLYGREMHDEAVFAPGDLRLDGEHGGLQGRMLLAVRGDFRAEEGNGSKFRGVLYVGGDAVLEGPFRFDGSLIVAGRLKVGGGDGEVTLRGSTSEVLALQGSLSRYRSGHDQRPTANGRAFGEPSGLRKKDD